MIYTNSESLVAKGVTLITKDTDPAIYNTAVLGGKGYHLCSMSMLGLPVPPALIIPTSVTQDDALVNSSELYEVIKDSLHQGNIDIFSVRSGAAVSMAGMMDTILNVGSTNAMKGTTIFELDCIRRFLHMYGVTVLKADSGLFEYGLDLVKKTQKVKEDCDLNVFYLTKLVNLYKKIHTTVLKSTIYAHSTEKQTKKCVLAVVDSWNNPRAKDYRIIHNIPDTMGTAVVIQKMVYGNRDMNSCSGVMFTRNPNTGELENNGEYLPMAQGEDVVSGVRTPRSCWDGVNTLYDWNSEVAKQLEDVAASLDTHYNDMQDIEFTVDNGTLYLLQTRSARRSAKAKAIGLLDQVKKGEITPEQARSCFTPSEYLELADATIVSKETPNYIGIAASNGVAIGKVVTSAQDAITAKEPVILVTEETNPDDFAGMVASAGVLTRTGGFTSHAAVVARGMNKTCVVGCTDLDMTTIQEGDTVAICGSTGRVWINAKVSVDCATTDPAIITMLLGDIKTPLSCAPQHIGLLPSNSYIIQGAPLLAATSLDEFVTLITTTTEPLLIDFKKGDKSPSEWDFLLKHSYQKGSDSVIKKLQYKKWEKARKLVTMYNLPTEWAVTLDKAGWAAQATPLTDTPTMSLYELLVERFV